MENNVLFFAKVNPDAVIPTKSDENAGYDVYACSPKGESGMMKPIMIKPHETVSIPTGIAAAVSKDYYIQVQERGSTGIKGLKYGAGVIDSGYRGEIFIVITNTNHHPMIICDPLDPSVFTYTREDYIYPINKAIAQLVIHKVPVMEVKEISYDELKNIPSDRGVGALGSSGK